MVAKIIQTSLGSMVLGPLIVAAIAALLVFDYVAFLTVPVGAGRNRLS